jgi:hypothetical protein
MSTSSDQARKPTRYILLHNAFEVTDFCIRSPLLKVGAARRGSEAVYLMQ